MPFFMWNGHTKYYSKSRILVVSLPLTSFIYQSLTIFSVKTEWNCFQLRKRECILCPLTLFSAIWRYLFYKLSSWSKIDYAVPWHDFQNQYLIGNDCFNSTLWLQKSYDAILFKIRPCESNFWSLTICQNWLFLWY